RLDASTRHLEHSAASDRCRDRRKCSRSGVGIHGRVRRSQAHQEKKLDAFEKPLTGRYWPLQSRRGQKEKSRVKTRVTAPRKQSAKRWAFLQHSKFSSDCCRETLD